MKNSTDDKTPNANSAARIREIGCTLHAHVAAETGLDPPDDRGLGHDEHDGRPHDSTRAKSRAARIVPSTEPETFDFVPAARG